MIFKAARTIRFFNRCAVSVLERLEITDAASESESSLEAYRIVFAPITFPGLGLLVSRVTNGWAELIVEVELSMWLGLFEVVRGLLLGFAVVTVELGSELDLLFVWLAFWRPLLVAVVAVVTWIFGCSD